MQQRMFLQMTKICLPKHALDLLSQLCNDDLSAAASGYALTLTPTSFPGDRRAVGFHPPLELAAAADRWVRCTPQPSSGVS